MKRATITLLLIAMLVSLCTGCCMTHDWRPATCTSPITCSECGKTDGEPLTHQWKAATCSSPKTCNRCNATEGQTLSHTWKDASCTAPRTCSVCNTTEGKAQGHTPGGWVVTKEPNAGVAGMQVRYCSICDDVVDSKDYFHGYFDMSFDEFVKVHNNTYRSQGWQIRKVDTGFSYFMDGEDTAIIFHEDLNAKNSNVVTAYVTTSLKEFNTIKFRYIDHGATSVDTENASLVLMLGILTVQPLVGYDSGSFLDNFTNNMEVTIYRNDSMQWEFTMDEYHFVLSAYVVDDYYSRVFYEFSCTVA